VCALAATKVVYKETFFLIRLTQKVNKNSVALAEFLLVLTTFSHSAPNQRGAQN
jgi:hypothetical protein